MNTKNPAHALVVLSGGQDSVTCLGIALKGFAQVSAIHFQYQSKHCAPELDAVNLLCDKNQVPLKVVDMGGLLASLVTSALTNSGPEREVGKPHPYKRNLPSSFVPGRNALFLVLAHAHAQEIQADKLITGVCETDFSGYPDCRDGFIRRMAQALNVGYETEIEIITPLMFLSKAQTFALADIVGILPEVLEHSHTCYNGDHTTRHEWGYGCGTCPACVLRRDGYAKYKSMKDVGHDFGYLNLSY